MYISQVIDKIKNYHYGIRNEQLIDDAISKDQVLYGDITKECTGIVIAIWPSIEVINQAIAKGANLIISHEALFWNRGDHTGWLEQSNNKTFQQKKELLDKYQITVWRDHDYIHSGIPIDDHYVDGIFWKFAKVIGWDQYVIGDTSKYREFLIPETTVSEVARNIMTIGGLKGSKIIGEPNTKVRKVIIPSHNLGDAKAIITKVDKENFDLVLAMELIDFTLSEYVLDSNMLSQNKTILTVGHFNLEKIGMKVMENVVKQIVKNTDLDCSFIDSSDMYNYVMNNE
ncbi:MAG: Nif3-like dinuclear metal center hexameric protein [Staphylococcus equorum]|uniref:Nif3-like dinuclear metal center hexameric protein n=1 Tax=Tetragenococcus koreensis TaxID=290335 RepID=UPI001F2FD853|nr:Nif3-like dinuclear metal center hexameric protein [Tetragenococcus koreensis]MDN6571343.1 Nif3-like dinuclear metal center hexameric protein [Staphylococcus equorum]MDN6836375.1 Nif3-like dinuclear metal center hexameric protein [Lactococcus lactis]MCF1615225.1 Nif3-like dinuclear metal center hexameric protein [Tetragenococcus koreensis]MCF1625019.1 Nif3-like dinuclear metal center hexameric protein [Tetragenococcus koreensis]MCF1627737.1 Nif3-like dinuclear metal center hexameric protein